MTSQLIAASLIYIGCVLEMSGTGADARGIEPRWLLLAAAHLLWTLRPGAAVLWGGLCGLCWAVTNGNDLGLSVVIVSTAVWGLGALRRDRRWSSGVAYLLIVFVSIVHCVMTLEGITALLAGTPLPEPRTWGIRACAQGAVTAFWGGGLWASLSGITYIGRRILPPLEWRTMRT